jgi:hypothetical protein
MNPVVDLARLTRTRRGLALFGAFLALTIFASACAPRADLKPGQSMPLASFAENSVEVSLRLTRAPEGYFLLEATFTPPESNHLYSKDLPLTGMDGLGRPTLLELPPDSKFIALGALIESVAPSLQEFESLQIPVYPAGPVTLRLPVALPEGTGWVDDFVSVTFMACNDNGCKPPVIGKVVPVRVPGAEAVSEP